MVWHTSIEKIEPGHQKVKKGLGRAFMEPRVFSTHSEMANESECAHKQFGPLGKKNLRFYFRHCAKVKTKKKKCGFQLPAGIFTNGESIPF